LAPLGLAPQLQSLPPILHMHCQNPIPGCSKGARGLSVQSRVSGIFTATTVSPSISSRQRPIRYTIRAGRNLPDKEFRSLYPAVSSRSGPYLHPPSSSRIFMRAGRSPPFIVSTTPMICSRPSLVRCRFPLTSLRTRLNLRKSTFFFVFSGC
jgi:hypothetical protein